MRSVNILRLVLGLFLLGAVGCDTEDKEVVLGHQGVARLNPYLAAERLIHGLGGQARSLPGWMEYTGEVTTLVMPGSNVVSDGFAERLFQWSSDGGHVVLTMSGGEGTVFDWNKNSLYSSGDSDLEDGLEYFLEKLEVEVVSNGISGSPVETPDRPDGGPSREPPGRSIKRVEFQWGDELEPLEFAAEKGLGLTLVNRKEGDLTDSEKEVHALVSREWGSGRITVLNHARPLRNAFIGNYDNASLVRHLWDQSGEGETLFVYGAGTSFGTLFWRHCRLVLLTALLLLAFWLWRGFPRFGPLKKEVISVTRDFSQHVTGSGQFYWKCKQPDFLLAPLRREVMQGYELEQINATEITRASLVDSYVEKTGLGAEDILEALTRKEIPDSTTLVRVIRNLQKMRLTL